MNLSRREILKLAALFSTAALPLSAYSKQNIASDDPLTIGYLPITDATPLLIAHEQGFYEQQGIKVNKPVRFRSWSQLVEAFLSAKVNLVHALSPMLIWLRYGSQAPVKMMTWNHISGSALTVNPSINSVKELAGKTVAIPFWYSVHNVVLQHLLRHHGLTAVEKAPKNNEVRLVVMPPSDMVAALGSGKISGFIVAEPFNAMAEHFNVGKILRFTADIWQDHACCVTLMHERDIEQRPEWTQKVVNAMVQAQIWAQENREATADKLSKSGKHKYTPHSSDILQRVLVANDELQQQYLQDGAIQHPDWHVQRIAFQPYPFPSYTEELVKMLKQTHVAGRNLFLADIDPVSAANDMTSDMFVRKALEQYDGFSFFGLPESLVRQENIKL